MRLPRLADLTPDQRRLYLSVPFTGRTLITGPPGTGKTVVAMLRALECGRSGRRTVVGMYNRMLRAYTSIPAGDPSLMDVQWPDVKTVRQFFGRLWAGLELPPHPAARRVLLDPPFEQNAEAKRLGARFDKWQWRPDGAKRGCWYVDMGIWLADRDAFAAWKPMSSPPAHDDEGFEIDWRAYAAHVIHSCAGNIPQTLHWGHLIIDEGQDFPPEFYEMLWMISEFGFAALPPHERPAVTVLADENQRLDARTNCRIEDIVKKLQVGGDSHYRLEDNFRNTAQIADVARHFYAGQSTGVPRRPERRGPVPVLRRLDHIGQGCEFIANYARTNPRDTIGVLVADNNEARVAHVSALRRELPRCLVQTYAWGDETSDRVGDIQFDMPGTILVLNRASCKGLEFDAVFIVELQAARIEEDALDFFRMGMYVMASRARKALFLSWVGDARTTPTFLEHMPAAPLLNTI